MLLRARLGNTKRGRNGFVGLSEPHELEDCGLTLSEWAARARAQDTLPLLRRHSQAPPAS
jgi:hypothetical protein